jgi:flavin-dependent dehydrogenase
MLLLYMNHSGGGFKVDVAIMGAGLSGLACAITLEKNGLTPTIFEKRGKVGDRFVNGEVLLSIFTRPVHDCIASLSEDYGIFLKPTSPIQKLEIYSKHEKAVIEGRLGFTNIRGREADSFESQLERQVKSDIHFHSGKSYEQLANEYTHVVMATGDGAYAKKNRNFREDLAVSIRGATVEGEFDHFTVMAWLDYDLAPYGYCYLIPFSEKEASISIAIPDIPQNADVDINRLWDSFYLKVQSQLQQNLPITDEFQITNYVMGVCETPRIGNTFYVGNCFGAMMPFMGFGQYASIVSGVYAAYDLCGLGKYEELMEPLRKSYDDALVLRRAMEHFTNDGLDRIILGLNGFIGEKIFEMKAINPLKLAGHLLKPYIKLTNGGSKT